MGHKSNPPLNISRFAGMRRGSTIGAGEIAIVAATGSRSAMRMAIAPPMECPTRMVVAGSIWLPANQRFDRGVRACFRFGEAEGILVVAVSGKVEQIGAQSVAREIGAEVVHGAAVGAQSVQQDGRTDGPHARRRLKDCGGRVATARQRSAHSRRGKLDRRTKAAPMTTERLQRSPESIASASCAVPRCAARA